MRPCLVTGRLPLFSTTRERETQSPEPPTTTRTVRKNACMRVIPVVPVAHGQFQLFRHNVMNRNHGERRDRPGLDHPPVWWTERRWSVLG